MAASFAFAINYEAILDNTTKAGMKETSFAFNRMKKILQSLLELFIIWFFYTTQKDHKILIYYLYYSVIFKKLCFIYRIHVQIVVKFITSIIISDFKNQILKIRRKKQESRREGQGTHSRFLFLTHLVLSVVELKCFFLIVAVVLQDKSPQDSSTT